MTLFLAEESSPSPKVLEESAIFFNSLALLALRYRFLRAAIARMAAIAENPGNVALAK
jgi:hypothetical protein